MALDNHNIDNLLDKYFEGHTTSEEEALLNHYFTSDKVASHLQQYVPLFQYFSNERDQKQAPEPRLDTQPKKRFWTSAIAAGLALFLGLYGWQYYERQQLAQEAYQNSQEALVLIGKYLNQGQDAIHELSYLEKSREIVFRTDK